jgi:2-polyprenyl-6-hydroxyphenyl methylase/3-demethylubiquinone-9 3-methyltransferase
MPDPAITFSFGENWQKFLDRAIDETQLEHASDRTRELLHVDHLKGRTFIDIGCGSGLFSYVAHLLGAARVISIDIDPLSVDCCRRMKEQAGNPQSWDIHLGSILDSAFVRSLPTSDIVYSWGVLHHTGDMWQAIRNAASLVRPGGRFAIAIYNKVEYRTLKHWRGSYGWLRIKRTYNRGGPIVKRAMELAMATKPIVGMIVRLRNPITEIRAYSSKRGMNWWRDNVDWLGGYPYEFATTGEIFTFCHNELGMRLEALASATSTGCHEFLFSTSNVVSPPRA